MTIELGLSREERSLFNPAFMALLSCRAVQGHATKHGPVCPLPLVVASVVMALQPAVRALLPATTAANLPRWAEDNPSVRVLMAANAPALSAVVRPGLLFALQIRALELGTAGLQLRPRSIPAGISGTSPTSVAIQKTAHMLARWLPTAGSTATALTLIGVRP
jgi:hypothetical protein